MTLAPFHIPDPVEITIDLPMPPSTNAIWRRSVKGMILSKDYKDWVRRCHAHLLATRQPRRRITGPCEAHIQLNLAMARSGSDVDNRAKAVLDYVQRIEMLDDDKLVMRLVVEWARPSAAPAGCRLTLRELAG